MTTSDEIKRKALELSEKTDSNSITPKEVGGIMHDLASLGENAIRNGGTLGIRKVYESVAAMEADSISPVDLWGNPIKKGNLVVIYDGTSSGVDNNKIYAFLKPGWQIATHLDAGYATKASLDAAIENVLLLFKKSENALNESIGNLEETVTGNKLEVDEKLSELGSEVITVKGSIKELIGEEHIIEDYHGSEEFISTDVFDRVNVGNVSSDSSYRSTGYIEISEDVNGIEAYCYGNNQFYGGVAFFTDRLPTSMISVYPRVSTGGSNSNFVIKINKSEIPSNAKYIRVSGLYSDISSCYVNIISVTYKGGVTESIDNLQETTDNIANSVGDIEGVVNGQAISKEDYHGSDEFVDDYIFDRANEGNLVKDTNYRSTGYIAIPSGIEKIEAVCYANNQYYGGVAFFAEKSPNSVVSVYPQVAGGGGNSNFLITIDKSKIPSEAKYVRAAGINSSIGSCYVRLYYRYNQKGIEDRIEDLELKIGSGTASEILNHSIVGRIDELTTSNSIVLDVPHTYKSYNIGFTAVVDSSSDWRIKISSVAAYNVGRIEVDKTNVYYYMNNTTTEAYRTFAHGLDIDKNIAITIVQKCLNNYQADVILSSKGNQAFDSNALCYWNMGGNTNLKATMVSGVCSSATLTFSLQNKRVWMFGDSYLDYITRNIKPASADKVNELLLDGYPGRVTQAGLTSLKKSLNIGKPEIIVWAMGMNDKDSSTAINSNWKSAYDEVTELCKANGVELVLVTIPTTPTNKNNYKNDIIRSSGYRYVDIAKAVGADGTGVWADGLLDADNVHPTAEGAKIIWGQYLSQVTEIIQY